MFKWYSSLFYYGLFIQAGPSIIFGFGAIITLHPIQPLYFNRRLQFLYVVIALKSVDDPGFSFAWVFGLGYTHLEDHARHLPL